MDPRHFEAVKMLKWFALFFLVQGLLAHPGSPQDDAEELRSFLKKTQEERDEVLEDVMAAHPESSAWENSGKYQGDILLRDEEVDAMVDEYANPEAEARNGLTATARRWPSATVAYEIQAGFFSAAQVNAIDSAAQWFQQNSCMRWVRRTNQATFVRITGRPTGCYANVGFWQNHIHVLNLAPNGCLNRQIIIHEMLHIAGFNHMHQTFNRNEWVQINMQNVQSGMEHNFNIFGSNVVTLFNTQYEYASNQHYGPRAFSSNGQPTVVALRAGGQDMGQLTHITAGDTLRLRRMYNCPGAFNVELTEEELNKPLTEEFVRRMDEAAEQA